MLVPASARDVVAPRSPMRPTIAAIATLSSKVPAPAAAQRR
jgi:hypothetical protein